MNCSTGKTRFDGPVGPLQGRIDCPPDEPSALAVIAHPHPLYGGSLDNKVVHTLAQTLSAAGALALRFNFRGVGESAGHYAEGRGEQADLLAVIEQGRQRWPGLPLWLAGFSFGAYVGLAAAEQAAPARLISIAPPVNLFPFAGLQAPEGAAWLVLQGAEDEIVPAVQLRAWLEGLAVRPAYVELPGAGHFFHGQINRLREALSAWLASPALV
ncbi:alpha/beta fold hydrolase [Thiohalobacter sp. IOR34]|uniref:alpha/beta hydrolase n=1 Tax=Thiohalobacter sp. IOR34 TaxID=3057176 RepID=UPI0025AF58A1|nr:alpha/beta fold hydrolase [Thiohalobacter sp. IOR34]WJW75825.1 alpha/beta fold hydrolase [Thiohalobacter sp. IOR34]